MGSETVPSSGFTIIADRYELGEAAGRGGMARVWIAEDKKLHRKVAVKLLNSDMSARPEVKERFKAEARAAARLNHPNVVSVYDTGEQEGVPYIVMELLSGKTLADEMKQGPMDQKRVLSVAGQTLAGLGAAHKAGIVHRDIKPGNILFTADGDTVKVADFGIAKGNEGMDLTQTGTLMGTPGYLAPEQVAGEPATSATDLYCLGVVLYEALAGRPPYDAETALALANKIYNEQPPPLSEVRQDIDPAIAGLVERAMAKDPLSRFSSAEEMSAAVSAALSGLSRPSRSRDDRTIAAPAAAVSADETQVLNRSPPAFGAPVGRQGRALSRPTALAVALSVLAVLLIVGIIAWQSLMQAVPDPPERESTPSPGGSPLPSPLERSLQRLEDAVRR